MATGANLLINKQKNAVWLGNCFMWRCVPVKFRARCFQVLLHEVLDGHKAQPASNQSSRMPEEPPTATKSPLQIVPPPLPHQTNKARLTPTSGGRGLQVLYSMCSMHVQEPRPALFFWWNAPKNYLGLSCRLLHPVCRNIYYTTKRLLSKSRHQLKPCKLVRISNHGMFTCQSPAICLAWRSVVC